MQAPGSSSDIVPLNSLEIESAWHLLSILIQQGCPPRLPDLASRSSLGQNLVEFLCRIPGSPLTITSGGFINVSDAGGEAFVDFVTRAVTLYVPRDVFRFLSLKRVSSNVSATYVRKRKAQNPSNADLLFPSSKKRSSLKHKRGEGEPRKNRGVPKLLSSSNEISRKVTFDVASPSDKEQYTVGMDTIHCCTAGLDRGHNFSALFHDLNYFEFGDIGCIGEEDTRASAHYATNSAAPHDKVIDFSYEYAALDDGLKASIMNEHALQHPKVVEHDFRPLLDGMLDKPSLMNQNLVENYLGEDCNSLSLELGLVSGIHDVHALERLNSIEKDFASLMDRVWDETAMGHISEYASLLACSKLPVAEAIAERNLLSNDDELVKLISVFDGGDQNSAALGLGMTKESAYVSELKHTTACEPCMQNNILAGSNIASNISSEEGQDKYIENFSQQKSIPNFESLTMEKELGSGEKELMKAEGLPKLLPLSNEITMKNSQEQKLLPNFESFIMQREECSGGGEPWKDEGWAKELSFSNQIPRKVNFDVQSPSVNEQHSFCMDTLDCSTVGLEQTYDLPVPLLDSSYFELRNISYMVEEDTTSTAPYNANSVISNMKVGSSNEDVSLDVGLNANVTKERAVERSNAVEPDLRPLLDGVLDQPSVMNQSLGEDCNILSVELGFVSGISEVHSHERLSMIQEKIEESLVERVCYDGIELHHVDHNDKNASMLPCINEVVIEAIDEINFHAKDDRIISGDLESNEIIVSLQSPCHRKEALIPTFASGDDVKNSAAVESATMAELDNVLEEKQRTLIDPHMKDHSASLGLQNLAESNMESNSTSSTKEQDRNVEIGLIVRQKVKDICNVNIPSKKNRVDAITMTPKNSSEQKLMPNFESFIIEEEEGSGGYGTVYRAQRKEDGRVFAVKCPHANAHSHHVNNELKMLERFGGRNFVIKYEGSFKNGDSECFVLEHVEHDRPEVLKKEIGVFELQWYGFCMFRALASLHKQGVVHRDVKPGNFLFSRNVNKGYLIDFNLASDLHQKFCRNSKRKIPSASTYPLSLLDSKSSPSFHSRKFIDHGLLENAKKEVANDAKRIQPSKSSKKKYQKDHDTFPIVERSKHGSQTADVSGLTSTKDQTSKTHADWLNQPMPSKGRKELINFVHKTMHSSQNLKPASNGPSSQRKRIAAPMSPSETGLLMVTPMPLHSGGNAVPGTGQKSKASGKAKREGPCVGTKGFRAPEVLFKSFHQGCKMDMWSAGVTLLYLMIGRAPFGGDPEQNIKEIARLRGSEELWEVAKLHNCESSFPVDLLDVGSLKSMGLREWCVKNTRRPDFLERISESLFDLVDKCLTVNPRCRISAEDALMHKFFAPCHESIRKQRMLRKVALSDPSSSNC